MSGDQSKKPSVELDLSEFDEEINKVIRKRFNDELAIVKNGVRTFSRFSIATEIFVLFILLGLSAFIYYQQWQQSQQINDLAKKLQQTNELVIQSQQSSNLVRKPPSTGQINPEVQAPQKVH